MRVISRNTLYEDSELDAPMEVKHYSEPLCGQKKNNSKSEKNPSESGR